MAWETVPAPNYAAFRSDALGNALGNLVSNYQQAQQGQQRTQANDLRNQQDKMLLDQSKAFAGGLPMNPDGTPNYSAIMKTLAEKGDINAVSSLAPILQQQQNLQGANAPDQFFPGGGGSSGASGGFMGTLHSAESGDQNVYSKVDPDPAGPGTRSQGYDQINVPTWQQFAPQAGVDLSKYPTPMSAPKDVQDAVAATIPLARFGPRTRQILESEFGFGDDQKSETIGQLASRYGGGGKETVVASLGETDASAYANSPDQPSIPPVSAAAGSSIPRANAATAVGAVGARSRNLRPCRGNWRRTIRHGPGSTRTPHRRPWDGLPRIGGDILSVSRHASPGQSGGHGGVQSGATEVDGREWTVWRCTASRASRSYGATGSFRVPRSGVCGVDRFDGWDTAASSGQYRKGAWRCS